ncbi:MAG: hypothetical protein WA771_15230 [Chthoniobacterales bacterium]
MKTPLLLVSIALLVACAAPDRTFREDAAAVAWLSPDGSRPQIDVTGSWFVPDWGSGYLAQTGNRIAGYLDQYSISGIVRGRSINLVISERGVTRYTGLVTATSPARLDGFYSRGIPFDPRRQRTLTFDKISR